MEEKTVTYVRCLKCQKILKCSRFDTDVLLQHIRCEHPEVQIVQSDIKDKKSKNNKEKEENSEKSKANPNSKHKNEVNHDGKVSHEGKDRHCDDTKPNEDEAKSKEKSPKKILLCSCIKKQDDDDLKEGPSKNKDKCDDKAVAGHDVKKTISRYDQSPDEDIAQQEMKKKKHIKGLSQKYPEIKECELRPRNPDAHTIYTKRFKMRTPTTVATASTVQEPYKCNLYRTTIERWRPGTGTIYCPQCGFNKRPLIQSRKEQYTQNQCFACCFFSCWPFCFLPCLIPDYEMEYLHCSNCKAFLGVYNRNSNCLKPNSQYVRSVDDYQSTYDHQMPEKSYPVSEKAYTETSATYSSNHCRNSKQPSHSIVIDGQRLHPDMVARLQRYEKYGYLAGIDLDAVDTEQNASEVSPLCSNSSRDDFSKNRPTSAYSNELYCEELS